ncbi:hypothetical protein ABZ858_13785 [Streptomyces sp. NPDC047017]|uniref:hypothetical protein n=1 Tax=Streptomyces sp. NPDC047017 TaxID=3155024 RepID=UPI0033EB1C07
MPIAPEALRERNTRSARSGRAALAWRATNAMSRAQAGDEDALAPDEIAEPSGEQQQAAEGDGIGGFGCTYWYVQ